MSEPRQDPDPAAKPEEQVPPGRQGADSGAADAVRVDPDGTTEMPDRSHGNDIPGVGPRCPDEADEPTTEEQIDAYRSSRSTELSDETGGAPHLNQREAP